MQITVETTDGSGIQRVVTIQQAAKQRIDISAAVVTAATQTYSGSAKTPTPTVTLNGSTVPSSGYDVAYSDNTNAGTAIITITGKGEYTGTAYGTFTINKATPTYTAPTARSLTYSGSAQYLTTTGSTSHGTIQYSNDGTNWYTTRRQGTNASSYTTYWRLIGDSNHNDIASTSIGVTIAQATVMGLHGTVIAIMEAVGLLRFSLPLMVVSCSSIRLSSILIPSTSASLDSLFELFSNYAKPSQRNLIKL